MGPSTFVFMLRWQFIPFVIGVAMAALSAVFLLTFKGDPPDAQFTSIGEMIGRPGGWIGIGIGLMIIGRAWYKASQLRNPN